MLLCLLPKLGTNNLRLSATPLAITSSASEKALDNVLIPNLLHQRKKIVSKLDEMEREDLIRLKTVEALLHARR